jgi:hypothetical protein
MTPLTIDRDSLRTGGNPSQHDRWIPTGYFAPHFHDHVQHELDRLAALPLNWDAQGARPIDAEIVRAARVFVAGLPPNIAKTPLVIPMAKGNLQFEWHDGPRSLELEIETPHQVHYLKWHPEEGVEDEGVYDIQDVDQSVALIRWFQRGIMNV